MQSLRLAPFFVVAMLSTASGPAFADDTLTTARVLVTGQGEENRAAAFARGFTDVLIKESGDPSLADDPAAAGLALNAAAAVNAFDYRDLMAGIPVHDEQGTRQRPFELTIAFDPAKIAAALTALGRAPWAGPRPRLAVFVAIRNGDLRYVLASDGERGADQRDSLAAAAWRYGMPLALPATAALATAGLTPETVAAGDPSTLDAAGAGGDVALAGSLVWDDTALGWRAEWRFAGNGAVRTWQASGVSFDAAFRSGIAGALQILSGHGDPRWGYPN